MKKNAKTIHQLQKTQAQPQDWQKMASAVSEIEISPEKPTPSLAPSGHSGVHEFQMQPFARNHAPPSERAYQYHAALSRRSWATGAEEKRAWLLGPKSAKSDLKRCCT